MSKDAAATRRSYPDVEDRLAEWRRASLLRQRRYDELDQIADPNLHGRNVFAQLGCVARVDSFLGTINSADPASAYAAPDELTAGGYAFRRENHAHPGLTELRSRFALDVVTSTGSELERAVRLRSWVNAQWTHGIPLAYPPYDSLVILERARGGEQFLCMHYAVVLVQCCLALGIQARVVNLHRGVADTYPIGDEAAVEPAVDEHVISEVYCSDARRWVVMDPDFDCHFEQNGEPLSAWEIHRAYLFGEQLVAVKGPGAAPYDALLAGDRAGPLLGAERADESAKGEWYERTLASYYAHVSLLMRNDFLSDPDGPVPILHLVDERTPPIVWLAGEDVRLRRDLLGPLAVARPFADRTPILTDGGDESSWASEDTAADHWVELTLPLPVAIEAIALHWPERHGRFQTSRSYRVEVRTRDDWRKVAHVDGNPERPWVVHDVDPATVVDAVRIVQPPGGGSRSHPNRLWLTQVLALADAHGAR